MTSKEMLKSICLECEKYKGKIQVACPFRSISNEYCDEYDTIKKDLDLLAKLEKVIQDYCYIDDFPQGKVIRMFVEENEESNEADFYLLKEVIENEK